MKKLITIFCGLFLTLNLFSQGYWTQKADFGGTQRYWSVGFAINGKGYAALGRGLGFPNSSDLWEYNPVTNAWTQKTSFPGGTRYSSHVFVINNKAYFCSGAYWSGAPGDYTPYNDVWEYDPATDTWTQKNNFPGPGRHDAFAFSFAGMGYLCFGQDDNQVRLNDLWQYNPTTDTWTQKATFPGTARSGGIQFGFQRFGYIGMGRDDNDVSLGDIWRYDCANNTWTQMNNFPAASRTSASTFVTDYRAYMVCGYNFQTTSYTPELWEYDPNSDTWVQREDFPPGDRACGTAFTINNKGYFGLGNVLSAFNKDFWEYTPSPGTGIKPVEQNGIQVDIFPNPSQNEITIEIKGHKVNSDILLTDINGKIVKTFPATSLKDKKLFIGQLPAGHYILSFDLNSERVSKEIIISK